MPAERPAAGATRKPLRGGPPVSAHEIGSPTPRGRNDKTLDSLRQAAESCEACPLYLHATHLVFGEGPQDARIMIVGEVPGDREDLTGKPFVGPAGRLLDEGLKQANIDRDQIYVTNAVKHFKWEPRGKRRLHKRPTAREISACQPWLEGELEIVDSKVVVCLGAVAAQSLLGREFRITARRGEVLETRWAPALVATWHPSAILRAPAPDRERMMNELFEDLKTAATAAR